MTTCARPGCEAPIRRGLLACRRHWYELSPAVRRAIYVGYERGVTSELYRRALRAAYRWWRENDLEGVGT